MQRLIPVHSINIKNSPRIIHEPGRTVQKLSCNNIRSYIFFIAEPSLKEAITINEFDSYIIIDYSVQEDADKPTIHVIGKNYETDDTGLPYKFDFAAVREKIIYNELLDETCLGVGTGLLLSHWTPYYFSKIKRIENAKHSSEFRSVVAKYFRILNKCKLLFNASISNYKIQHPASSISNRRISLSDSYVRKSVEALTNHLLLKFNNKGDILNLNQVSKAVIMMNKFNCEPKIKINRVSYDDSSFLSTIINKPNDGIMFDISDKRTLFYDNAIGFDYFISSV